MINKPWFIPDTTSMQDQLHAFRLRRSHFAVVVDEYGGLEGIVTLEDILEEIVGRIDDEHDPYDSRIFKQQDGSVIAMGDVSVRDLNREMEWKLPDEEASTVAGLLIHEAREIPFKGARFHFHGYEFEVLAREGNQLTRLRITAQKN
jgi:Mg2+/Co2+ transporter CorB